MSASEWIAGAAVSTFILILTLGCVEYVLRIFFHVPELIAGYYPLGTAVSGADIKVIQREYATDMHYNTQGFRDREFSFYTNGESRVLFLGDSFVEGMGVGEDERASSYLEHRLRENGSDKVTVINAGQIATNPISYFENLVSFGLALDPKYVVVGVFIGNDFIGGREHPIRKPYTVKAREDLPIGASKTYGTLLNLGYTRALVRTAFGANDYLIKSVKTNKFWEFYYKKPIDISFYSQQLNFTQAEFRSATEDYHDDILQDFLVGRLNPSYLLAALEMAKKNDDVEANSAYSAGDEETVTEIIKEMASLCAQRGIGFLVVLYPDIYEVMPAQYSEHLTQNLRMRRIPERLQQLDGLRETFGQRLENLGIDNLDLKPYLSGADYYLFDGHLNKKGQKTVGELLYQVIRPLLVSM